jgi:DNA-binding CsgD family transcriptional regulator
MSTIDPVPPVFYILFGAFMVLVALHLWRSLRQHLSRNDHLVTESKAFSVHLIDASQSQSNDRRWQLDTLTPREMDVARLAAYGRRNAEIANELHISTLTVETHLKHIYGKPKVRSRTELASVIRDLVD